MPSSLAPVYRRDLKSEDTVEERKAGGGQQ